MIFTIIYSYSHFADKWRQFGCGVAKCMTLCIMLRGCQSCATSFCPCAQHMQIIAPQNCHKKYACGSYADRYFTRLTFCTDAFCDAIVRCVRMCEVARNITRYTFHIIVCMWSQPNARLKMLFPTYIQIQCFFAQSRRGQPARNPRHNNAPNVCASVSVLYECRQIPYSLAHKLLAHLAVVVIVSSSTHPHSRRVLCK